MAYTVTTSNSSLEFDTQASTNKDCVLLDSNHIVTCWCGGASAYAYGQIFEINTSTWAVTTAGSSFEFYTSGFLYPSMSLIDANHTIIFWNGSGNDGYTQTFAINTSTWAVTTSSALLEFDAAQGDYNSCCKLDDNHFINFWCTGDSDGFTQVFVVNTSTWAVTTAAASLEFDTQQNYYNSCAKIDDTHVINFWSGGASQYAYAQVFAINTSTWVVTTAAASLEFNTSVKSSSYNKCFQIDSNHFINFFTDSSYDGFAQVFTVNTTTWAVTTANSSLEYDTQFSYEGSVTGIDDNHFLYFWVGVDYKGYTQIFEVNTSTWAVTTASSVLTFETSGNTTKHSCVQVDTSHFVNFWGGKDADGFVQVFTAGEAASGPANLKTLNTSAKANIKSINTSAIANVKSWNTTT